MEKENETYPDLDFNQNPNDLYYRNKKMNKKNVIIIFVIWSILLFIGAVSLFSHFGKGASANNNVEQITTVSQKREALEKELKQLNETYKQKSDELKTITQKRDQKKKDLEQIYKEITKDIQGGVAEEGF